MCMCAWMYVRTKTRMATISELPIKTFHSAAMPTGAGIG